MTDHTTGWAGHGSNGGGDWATLYAQYVMRSANQSTRTTELYQQILECVARGQLAPTAFRDALPTFAQTNGSGYSAELAQINTRFFSGLVELTTAYGQPLVDLVLPGVSVPPVPPPSFDAGDPLKWYQQLTDYAGQLNTAAAAAYQTMLAQVAAGQVAPDKVQQAAADYAKERLPEHLRRLSQLYFDLLNSLNDLRAEFEEIFLSDVLATAQPHDPDIPIALNLSGPLGGVASASLLLTNTQAQPATLRCRVTDLRRADGVGPAFAAPIIIAPEALELPPGAEANVVVSLRLAEADFDPEVLYVGAVQIMRRGEPRLDVPLRITTTPAAPVLAPSVRDETYQRRR
jgi:hypothetical protein